MDLLQDEVVHCPYCGEAIGLQLDLSAGSQEYVEDCAVCCQPMVVTVEPGGDGSYRVSVERENG